MISLYSPFWDTFTPSSTTSTRKTHHSTTACEDTWNVIQGEGLKVRDVGPKDCGLVFHPSVRCMCHDEAVRQRVDDGRALRLESTLIFRFRLLNLITKYQTSIVCISDDTLHQVIWNLLVICQRTRLNTILQKIKRVPPRQTYCFESLSALNGHNLVLFFPKSTLSFFFDIFEVAWERGRDKGVWSTVILCASRQFDQGIFWNFESVELLSTLWHNIFRKKKTTTKVVLNILQPACIEIWKR